MIAFMIIKEALVAFWKFLKGIPPKVWLALLILVLTFAYGHLRYNAGYDKANAEVTAKLIKQHALA